MFTVEPYHSACVLNAHLKQLSAKGERTYDETILPALILAAFVSSIWATPALAQLASSKATADVNTLVKCKFSTATANDGAFVVPTTCVDWFSGATVDTSGAWIEIMSSPMKLSNSQSLFVSPSLVTGLYTQTRTKTNDGGTSTAQAIGAVYLRAVLIPDGGGDPIVAAPLNLCSASVFGCNAINNQWGVVLDSRIQTLSQSITDCTVLVSGVSGTCDFTSTIDLIRRQPALTRSTSSSRVLAKAHHDQDLCCSGIRCDRNWQRIGGRRRRVWPGIDDRGISAARPRLRVLNADRSDPCGSFTWCPRRRATVPPHGSGCRHPSGRPFLKT